MSVLCKFSHGGEATVSVVTGLPMLCVCDAGDLGAAAGRAERPVRRVQRPQGTATVPDRLCVRVLLDCTGEESVAQCALGCARAVDSG